MPMKFYFPLKPIKKYHRLRRDEKCEKERDWQAGCSFLMRSKETKLSYTEDILDKCKLLAVEKRDSRERAKELTCIEDELYFRRTRIRRGAICEITFEERAGLKSVLKYVIRVKSMDKYGFI